MADSNVPNPIETEVAIVMAGVPAVNNALYRRLRFIVGDPAALVELPRAEGRRESTLILRDIEMARARRQARADHVVCPADFTPATGLSGDRETATAQATAECLRRAGVRRVVADRTLPLIYASEIQRVGIAVDCDADLGVAERRSKDAQEIEYLRAAQMVTEDAIRMACQMVARATARDDGVLMVDREPLTSQRARAAVDVWLLKQGYTNPESIVAGGRAGADCHDHGAGPLRSGQPVIIDIFPRNRKTLYNGDCTRTVVHGEVSDAVAKMHAAVVEAKAAAISAVRAGVTGQDVHSACIDVIRRHGYDVGLPADNAEATYCAMTHGTGHGVGLDVHEPPLLDIGGPPLVVGDCLTIEPGLYSKAIGGVRVEDMVIVTQDGCINLNRLPEGLDWS
jgi:Xaa-Pro aminopeptidase